MVCEKQTSSNANCGLSTADSPLTNDHWPLPNGRQIWAEVDLQVLKENYRALTSLLSPAPVDGASFSIRNPRIIPVIKAEAYGHGMVPVAHALSDAGASAFAVGFVDEGLRLRLGGITQEVLVLGTSWSGQEAAAIQNRLTLAIDSPERVHSLEKAARELDAPASVHIKVDTGMARLGIRWNSMEPLLREIGQAAKVCLKGVFSHLSSADESNPSFTLEQIRRFEQSLSIVEDSGLDCGEIHLANSAGLLFFKQLRRWSARTGIAIYGYAPDPRRPVLELRPVLCLKTRIGTIRSLPLGEPIGYNRRHIASRNSRVTTLPVGYADGFNRRLRNGGRVIVRDRWAPVIGTVSMDMITVDLTDLPEAQEGDEVILLGSSPHCRITAAEWADILDTIPYEVLCGIASRVPRICV
jgi:alanine racemase